MPKFGFKTKHFKHIVPKLTHLTGHWSDDHINILCKFMKENCQVSKCLRSRLLSTLWGVAIYFSFSALNSNYYYQVDTDVRINNQSFTLKCSKLLVNRLDSTRLDLNLILVLYKLQFDYNIVCGFNFTQLHKYVIM